jgi:hypothetical protein
MPGRGLEPPCDLLEEEPGGKDRDSPGDQRQPRLAVEGNVEGDPRESDYPPGDHQARPHSSREGVDGFIDFGRRRGPALVTEYEQLLGDMLKERRERLEALKASKGKNSKKIDVLLSEIGFVEGELERYRRGLRLFRTKELPKVGRWGKPETSPQGEALP